jgi:hypothetical protein
MNRIVYSIVHRNDEWHVTKVNDNATEGRFKNKSDAIDLGRFLAMREEVAILRITQVDGSIQSEILYARNPQTVEG